MSSQPPASAPSTGISKSAAKKRAKKAKAAANKQQESAQAGLATSATDKSGRLSTPSLERYLYPNPPGSYPGDDNYDDSNVYYDDEEDLPPQASSGQGSGGGGGVHDEQFSFASYAFGDRTFAPPTNGSPFGGLSQAINITHEDLLETANELWKRMGETQYGEDDPYWSSLPPHVRQFIREAIPFNAPSNTSNDPQATQKDLYAMAQRIVHAASQGMGLQGVGSNLLSQVNGRAHLQASIAEDLGFHRHPDAAGRIDEEFDDDEDFEDEPEHGHAQPNGDAPKKKNKKKKKKASHAAVEPPPATLPPPAVKQPPRQPVPPQPAVQQPALNPPPPPVAPVPSQPPPSSRAAGKQPMSHVPAPPANPPARSVRAAGKAPVSAASQHAHHNHSHPPPSKSTSSKGKAVANPQPTKIWNNASPEEREAITFFWLGLKESDRRELLQLEKDAVLKRMKDQQRHSCSCAVCGRKKINIELELEQLYDQYYDDLERYTEHNRIAAEGEYPRPPGPGPFPGSIEMDSTGQLLQHDGLGAYRPTPDALDESDEYEDEDDYDDEEELDDDELGSEDADVDYPPRKPAKANSGARNASGEEFFGFGSSLATIKGIVTVADDMLKNDGTRFLEMMEQLADKRVSREDLNVRDLHEETDEEDEGEDYEVSEAQRVEDGRRMFAIFAARMFEQRVLQAYREGLAKEREEQLLRELEMEEDTKRQKEEKKAKEAQRKKDKKRLQKQRQEEERAAREAAQAEEQRLAKLKAEEEAKERQRKQEEERQRREAVKRAALEEASRKEAERKKRQEEERIREEEAARKKREREEKVKKEREAREREAKEKERRDKEERDRQAKAKAEKDRIAKEAKDKAEKERQAKAEEGRAERQRRDEAARRDREAAEQKKLLAAQQAAREKAAADKAAADKGAADKKAAGSTVRPPPGAARKVTATAPPPSRTNGPASSSSTPALMPSPPTPGSARPASTSRGPPKTPQAYTSFQQPVPTMSHGRPTQPPGFAPGSYGRPQGFPGQSPVFASSNGQMQLPSSIGGSLSGSPSASVPRYAGVPDTFDSFESRAPLGVGYPKSAAGPSRVASTEDPFRVPPTPVAPIGQRVPSQPASVYGDHDEFILGGPDPIAPPGPIGSRPSGSVAPSRSPPPPGQVLGSAALGDDDEIVQPAARRAPSSNWKLPPAPGAGRWSAAPPSIWGMEQSPWSAPPRGFQAPLAPGAPAPSLEPLAPGAPPGVDPRRPGFNQPYYGQNLYGPH